METLSITVEDQLNEMLALNKRQLKSGDYDALVKALVIACMATARSRQEGKQKAFIKVLTRVVGE